MGTGGMGEGCGPGGVKRLREKSHLVTLGVILEFISILEMLPKTNWRIQLPYNIRPAVQGECHRTIIFDGAGPILGTLKPYDVCPGTVPKYCFTFMFY